MKSPTTAGHVIDTSSVARDTRHSYASFVNQLPMYFAGKYWCFYLAGNKVREPHRIDPLKESLCFFSVAPEDTSMNMWIEGFVTPFQSFVSNLTIEWYDNDEEWVAGSNANYLPLTDSSLSAMFERTSFAHSLVDIEPSEDEIMSLAVAKVAEAYSKVEGVSAIYVSRYLDDITVTVLLENAKYSRHLMDRLLDIEYTLHKQNPLVAMEFLYLPKLYKDRTEVIHPKAKLIYDRDINAVLSGSYVSSAT